MIYFYHLLTILLLPLYLIFLGSRIITGKENLRSLSQRFGIASHKRPAGQLIWLHAASVGEALIAVTLIEGINQLYPLINILVTCGTMSSATLLQKQLPPNAQQQFLPVDNIIFVRKFLRTWRPTIGILIESELWPCLVSQSAKSCPLLLFNARISDRSFQSWLKLPSLFQLINRHFSHIIVQSPLDLKKFQQLGVKNAVNFGNIKFSNKKLVVNDQILANFLKHLAGRKIIVLASTHLEDEQIIFELIKPIKQSQPSSYFILIPRHPERRSTIIKLCQQLKLSYHLYSATALPVLNDDLYIVDDFGQMGLFFSLADITFIGGSFKHGGHNLLEPAHFGNVIIFGPDMSNFQAITSQMIEHQAALQVQDCDHLLSSLQNLLADDQQSQHYQTKALEFINQHQQILDNYLKIVEQAMQSPCQ